jgi:hypothetical protein
MHTASLCSKGIPPGIKLQDKLMSISFPDIMDKAIDKQLYILRPTGDESYVYQISTVGSTNSPRFNVTAGWRFHVKFPDYEGIPAHKGSCPQW